MFFLVDTITPLFGCTKCFLTGLLFMGVLAVSSLCLRQTKLQGIAQHYLSHNPCHLNLPRGRVVIQTYGYGVGRMKDKPRRKSGKKGRKS